MFNKFIILISSFLIIGCNTNERIVKPFNPELETISFDVVQKKLMIEQDLPINIQNLINKWFDQKIKIDGFDGEMTFTILEYLEETSSISDGKRVDISLSFNVVLNKPSLSKTHMIEGSVFSYGTLTGNFSLTDFETVIQNTQSDLVLRLSRDLKSKI